MTFSVIFSLFALFSFLRDADTCISTGYHFEILDSVRLPWRSTQQHNSSNENVLYQISVCRPLTSSPGNCSLNTSICRIRNGEGSNIGAYFNSSTNSEIVYENPLTKEVTITWFGDLCQLQPKGVNNTSQNWQTKITFRCGKTLGVPEFVQSYACDTYFEWKTSAACKTAVEFSMPESVCYTHDALGKKRDLSPLIKTTGAYAVLMSDETSDSSTMFINVCRHISQGKYKNPCEGYAACLVTNGTVHNIGQINSSSTALTIDNNDDSVSLWYYSNTADVNCSSGQRSTVINFRCPSYRQRNAGPILVSSSHCTYHVNWMTEYACPEEYHSSASCQLSVGQHGIDIDLSSLAKPSGSPYVVYGNDTRGKRYEYKLNVCSNSSVPCSEDQLSSSCQRDPLSGRMSSIGHYNRQTLRYADNTFTLFYKNGTSCSNGFPRETIIHFQCNETAGKGEPVYSTEEHCSYVFTWSTSLVCVDTFPAECYTIVDNKLFDLSSLTRSDDEASWVVASGDPDERIIVNVCQNVSTVNGGAGCPPTAAACLIKSSAGSARKFVSLGRFKSAPSYDQGTKLVNLQYTDGDECSATERYSTRIVFRCLPGNHRAGPMEVVKSANGCQFEIIWYTAAACVVSERVGDWSCRVEDSDADYSFDLSPLTKADDSYVIASNKTGNKYYINVCDDVHNAPCVDGAGACSVGKINRTLGMADEKLHYRNGILSLVYRFDAGPQTRTEIMFLCDKSAGIGSPVIETESDDSYVFLWNTAFACLPELADCFTIDKSTGQRYDLSGLVKEDGDNWETTITLANGRERKIHINFCRSVLSAANVLRACEPTAGACATEMTGDKEFVTAANLGSPASGPVVQSRGNLVLEYVDGAVCTDVDNSTKRYSLTISLHCNSEREGSMVSNADGYCRYTVELDTRAACPVSDSVIADPGSCVLDDRSTGTVYDLKQLRKSGSYYTSNSSQHYFKLGICEAVKDCPGRDVAVCDGQTVLGLASTVRLQLNDGLLQLIYSNQNNASTVIVDLVCGRNTDKTQTQLDFIEQNGNLYLFELTTDVACTPTTVTECHAYSENSDQKYDLSPLMKYSSNWLLRASDVEDKFYINVCHSVNDASDAICSGKKVGGCHILPNGTEYNMGYIRGALHVDSVGLLTLTYVNGDMCRPGVHRSTVITFTCSNVEHFPVVSIADDGCRYDIEWHTTFACPLKRGIGSNCRVKHPLYDHEFGLDALRSQGTNMWTINTTAGYFVLNVCGAISTPSLPAPNDCGGNDVGACFVKNGTAVNIGNFNKVLEYDDGNLRLVYSDGKENCGRVNNRTTHIIFTCHLSKYGTNGPTFLESQSTDCSFFFEWPTSLACMSMDIQSCSITDKIGHAYDLSPLMLENRNYGVTSSDGTERFIINVCSPLVNERGNLCPPRSTVCLISANSSDPTQQIYTKIGSLNDTVSLSFGTDEQLSLTYYGDLCQTGLPSQTVINFRCHPSAPDNSGPDFMGEDGKNCIYTFVWFTKYACPVSNVSEPSGESCAITDHRTGYQYNFNALKRTPVYEVQETDYIYYLSVCQALSNSSCGETSASCQREKIGERRWFNAGNVTFQSILMSNEDIVRLEYRGGQHCRHHNNVFRTTVISFVCTSTANATYDDELSPASLGQPRFDSAIDCTYYFVWHTPLACQQQVQCSAVVENKKIDLTSLMSAVDHSINSGGGNSVTIALCRPLDKIGQRHCPRGAASCLQMTNGTLVNLGRLNQSPQFNAGERQVTLTYDNGDICNVATGQRWQSVIRFTCQPVAKQTVPLLTSVNNNECKYEFEWQTSEVCDESLVAPTGGCIFTDEQTRSTYNMTVFSGRTENITDDSRSKVVYASICGTVSQSTCPAASVCVINVNDGSKRVYGLNETILEGDVVKLVYSIRPFPRQSPCARANAILRLHCDVDASRESKPGFKEVGSCSALMEWSTPLACVLNTRQSPVLPSTSTQIYTTIPSTVMPTNTTSERDAVQALPKGASHHVAMTVGIAIVCISVFLLLIAIFTVMAHPNRRDTVRSYATAVCQNCTFSHAANYSAVGDGDANRSAESERLLSRSSLGNIQTYDSDDDILL